MAVLAAHSYTLEVPELEPGIEFYSHAGLEPAVTDGRADFFCAGQDHPSVTLVGGAKHKRLHHIALRADNLDTMPEGIEGAGGTLVDAPVGFDGAGLWLTDPHGMVIHLVDSPIARPQVPEGEPFMINTPGRVLRKRRSAVLPQSQYGSAKPQKLGHILVFTPNVMRSVSFMTEGLGMGLADRAQDIIAFTCGRKDSDHHVVAFAKSSGIGFHHGSFEVADPDEVGRGGRALASKAARHDWGFGRHTIGSNFFHYIQDPWGSWFEYYSDIDHIDDYSLWTPTNYEMEDSLASWGPELPPDFVHNYELDDQPYPNELAEREVE